MMPKKAIITTVLMLSTVPGYAHADPPLNEAWKTACYLLGQHLTGEPSNDSWVFLGVVDRFSSTYSISRNDAARLVNQGVKNHCPQYWPNLVAIGSPQQWP
jgi:hypothetical protein